MREMLTRRSTLGGAVLTFTFATAARFLPIPRAFEALLLAGFAGGIVAGALTPTIRAPTGPGATQGVLGAVGLTLVLLVQYLFGNYTFAGEDVLGGIVAIAGPLLEAAGYGGAWLFMGVLGALLGQKLFAKRLQKRGVIEGVETDW